MQIFLPHQGADGDGHLAQRHFGYIAGGSTQDRDGFRGVEIIDTTEIQRLKIGRRVLAATGQQHKGHAVLQQTSEPYLGAILVQFFQQAALFYSEQVRIVVGEVVLHNIFGCIQQAGVEVCPVCDLAKMVFQRLNDCGLILRLHLPDGDNPPGPAVGVRHVKDMPQFIGSVRVHQQGDPVGPLVDIAPMPVPEVDFRTGGSLWFLCVNQQLVPEVVFEVVGRGGEERHIRLAASGDLLCGSGGQGHDGFIFSRQDAALLS